MTGGPEPAQPPAADGKIAAVNTPSRLRTLLWSSSAAALCAVLLMATSPGLPLVWDEGDSIARADQIDAWQASERADAPWPYTIVREGHPPLSGMLVACGRRIAPDWLDPLTAARLGPMLWFALAAGAMCYRLARDYSTPAVTIMALVALVTMPRLFAHEHFATLDGPLTAAWVIAWATFSPAVRQVRWAPLFGLALGLTLAAKFTGWLAPLPFIAWTLLTKSRGGAQALAIGLPVALVVFVALNPPLWHEPLSGLRTFFELNLNRSEQGHLNVSTWFLGRMYNLDHPLPWYNTLVWTVMTISPVTLFLGVYGIVWSISRWRVDTASWLVVCQWATLVIVRALPWAPPHDAERLILPSFAFFAMLVGIGVGRGLYRDTLLTRPRIIAQGWAKVAVALTLAAALFDSVTYFGHNLSYYSRLVGGLRGAVALGLEPTYYWDALDRKTLAWLAENAADDQKVAFAAAPPQNLKLLKAWGLLARTPDDPGTFRWYVVQRRPSANSQLDHWLFENAKPAYQHSFGGVPLLDVYDYVDYQRASTEVAKTVAQPADGQ